MTDTQTRSVQEVFDDHLAECQHGCVERDADRNYAPDVILLTGRGVYRGHDGLRHLARLLQEEIPDTTFVYKTRLVENEFTFLEWEARTSDQTKVAEGTDTFCIREGKIVVQSISYSIEPL